MGAADPTAVDLLEHSRWVRSLARRLARDASAADDLAQQTWLAALEDPPADSSAPRRWLGAVVRNFARQERRADRHRREREELVARTEAARSPAELVARAELEQELVAAVLALDEPYRTTVLLRFFEELPPRAIARRTGVPVETVKTRLARALARLRTRLEDARPHRRAWLILAAPLADPHAASSTALGTLLMNAKLKVSIAAASLLGAVGLYVALDPRADTVTPPVVEAGAPAPAQRPADASAARDAGTAELQPGAAPSEARVRGGERRELTPAEDRAHAPSIAAAAPSLRLRVRVLDEHGRPVAGIALGVSPGADALAPSPGANALAISGADGSVEIDPPRKSIALVSRDPRFATILAGRIGPEVTSGETIVVVAPSVEVAGQVQDERGLPLAGARLHVDAPADFRARFREILDRSLSIERGTASDESGAFRLSDVPYVEGAVLRAALDGYAPAEIPLAPVSEENALVVLARPGPAEDVVAGIVLDASGLPVDAARVAFGLDSQRSGRDGRFAFRLAQEEESFNAHFRREPDALVAVRPGFLPARYEPPMATGAAGAAGARVWPRFVTLRLGTPTLSIAGRVVDDEDEPVRGAQVWLSDPSFFGAVDGRPAQLESLLAGAEGGQGPWHFVTTDGEGAFAIEGLLDRTYRLQAMDPSTLLRSESEPVPAGTTGMRLKLPTDQLHPLVAGRIVSNAGAPIAGVSVYPMCDAFRMRLDGRVIGTSHAAVNGTQTDAEGRFQLRNVPKSLVYLRIDGEPILPLEYGRYVEGDERFEDTDVKELPVDRIEELVIAVDQRAHFRLELIDPASADALAVLDERGRTLETSVYDGGGRRDGPQQRIQGGHTESIAAPDRGKTLVLYRQGVEVARRSLALVPGELLEVRM